MSSQADPSWCRTTLGDKEEATFRWTIEKFKNRPEKCKEFLDSSVFTVNGPGDLKSKWKIRIYPKGIESNEDFVSLFLYTKVNFKVNAEYKIDILDAAGMEKFTYTAALKEYDITGVTPGATNWGSKNMVEREEFNNDPDLLPDGNLILKCTITVFGTGKVLSGSDLDSSPNLSIQSQKQLGEQLGKVFSDKLFTDLKIQCEGQTFDCHKAILASRSDV